MATVNIVLRASRTDKKGRSPLLIRISDSETHRTRSLGEKIKASAWNADKQVVRARHPEATRINAVIAQAKSEAAGIQRALRWEDRELGAAELADELWRKEVPAPALDFFGFAETWRDRLLAEDRINYYKRAKSVIAKLRDTVEGPLPFDQFDAGVLEAHDRRMRDVLGNSANTRNVSFTLIRTIVLLAIKEGAMTPNDDPFRRFSKPKGTSVEKTRLNVQQVDSIRALDLNGDPDISRDLFLFAVYGAGIRFGDAVSLRWKNIKKSDDGERLVYKMSKTGAISDVRLLPQAIQILDKYRKDSVPKSDAFIFPYLDRHRGLRTAAGVQNAIGSRNVVVNRNLKEIATLAEIDEHLTFHVSRHTFAEVALAGGASVYDIMCALRHSSLKETQTYLASFRSKAADAAVASAFGTAKNKPPEQE